VHPYLAVVIVWTVAMVGPPRSWAQDIPAARAGTREIARLRDDLYLVRDGPQYTVFVATSEGIILCDPLSRPTALWLRDEIRARFRQDVRFVLHTSHDYLRAAGSSVFDDTANIVAHWAITPELARAQREQPEHYGFAIHTTLALDRQRLVTLGGQTVVMIHVPASRTPEMTVLHFPRERIVFAADLPRIESLPFSFGAFKPRDVFAWIDALNRLEFDSVVLGDGRTVSRAEFDALATYLLALRAAVTSGVREGRTLSRVALSGTLDQFRANPHYANRASLVSDIYRTVEASAIQVSAGPATTYARLSPAFCASRTLCSGGGTVPAARFTASVGRIVPGLDLMGELTLGGQTLSKRTTPDIDQEAATRRSRGSLLVRFPSRRAGLSYGFVVGVSITAHDVRGFDRVKAVQPPRGGSHPIEQRTYARGLTFGGDLEHAVGRFMTIRVPVRITKAFSQPPDRYLESTFDVQAGIDVTFRLSSRVFFR
jgi:glyoxylase-like metal-dependent hydrolase (beta-lactamase superfamily II)